MHAYGVCKFTKKVEGWHTFKHDSEYVVVRVYQRRGLHQLGVPCLRHSGSGYPRQRLQRSHDAFVVLQLCPVVLCTMSPATR